MIGFLTFFGKNYSLQAVLHYLKSQIEMASHQTYEEGKKLVFYGLKLLAAITILEVFLALWAKGHIPGLPGFYETSLGRPLYMVAMIGASLYKAYFIVYNFMHMAFEMRGLALSVLLPMLLLVWAIIAFFHEGSRWGASRELIKEKNELPAGKATGPKKESYILPTQGGNQYDYILPTTGSQKG